jgi:hypothetical protein
MDVSFSKELEELECDDHSSKPSSSRRTGVANCISLSFRACSPTVQFSRYTPMEEFKKQLGQSPEHISSKKKKSPEHILQLNRSASPSTKDEYGELQVGPSCLKPRVQGPHLLRLILAK